MKVFPVLYTSVCERCGIGEEQAFRKQECQCFLSHATRFLRIFLRLWSFVGARFLGNYKIYTQNCEITILRTKVRIVI